MIDYEIVIIGAGLNGICCGYYCNLYNYNFLLLEKSDKIGGIWSNKEVPGIRTDSTMNQYTYSFNKKRTIFKNQYASGAQICDYLEETAKKFNIYDKIKFKEKVMSCYFNSKTNIWKIVTNNKIYYSRFLINCNGYFNKDKYHEPKFKNSDKFKNKIIHIYNIKNKSVYENKNVLLLGSGAMAISSMPTIYKHSKKLVWVQRSPTYISEWTQKLSYIDYTLDYIDNNYVNSAVTLYEQFMNDIVFVLFRKIPILGRLFFYYEYKSTGVSDKFIENHLTPKYNPWDQRIAISLPGFLKFVEDNIETHTTTIKELQSTSVVLNNNKVLKNIDTIILATGFVINLVQFEIYVDNKKQNITKELKYFKHSLITNIPNYFQLIGTLHSTYTVKIENLYKYIFSIINHMRANNYKYIRIPNCDYKTRNPNLKSGYLKRRLEFMPETVGIIDIPTMDLLYGNYKFNENDYIFDNSYKYDHLICDKKIHKSSNTYIITLLIVLSILSIIFYYKNNR